MPRRSRNHRQHLPASFAPVADCECASNLTNLRAVIVSLAVIAAVVVAMIPARAAERGNSIVLIGGDWTSRPGEHDWPHGVKFIEEMLKQSPQVAAYSDLTIDAHPYGWPGNESLQHAATVVLYFNGDGSNPLLDPKKRDVLAQLMNREVGLVALHQSFTLPEGNTDVPMQQWLGGVRYGKHDRTTKPAELIVGMGNHPVLRGLENFVHYDEYYPTLEFNNSNGKITPVWTAELPIHYLEGVPTASIPPAAYVVAWAYERENGGRSFAYSGGHFQKSWDDVQARTALLNAILWTAGKDVPPAGATTNAKPDAASKLSFPGGESTRMTNAVVSKPDDYELVELPWGRIEWYVSGALGNSRSMTVGLATVLPGKANPVHFHPNCNEVLHVLTGKILHSMNGATVEMSAGDTISIPQGVHHNATNIGDEDAELAISFDTAWREVVGE